MELSRLHGIFTPTLTPLTPEETVDEPSLRRLVDFLIEAGVHGLWVMGTTGEFPCLPETERARAVAIAVEQAAGRVPVVANVGDSSTALALRHARHATEAGADGLASTPPHYFPHTMDETVAHFRALKEAHPELPLLAYNIPQTVKVRMTLDAVLTLAREGVCAGIKDSQNDLEWFRSLVLALRGEGLAERFRCFLGSRILIDAGLVIGAAGAVPAVSNVAPSACVAVYEAVRRGDPAAGAGAPEQAIRFEDLKLVAGGGSGNAASLGTMKHVLRLWGVIDHATLSRPLRPLAPGEVEELRRRLAGLPRPAGVTAMA
jgi:4-hydroxy-tetrahydrodipicolinate synthase